MEFPQYRRYKNKQSYFKIVSNEEFVEYKLTANKLESYRFTVKILPDRNYLHDMLYNYEPYWEVLSEKEFKLFLRKWL